MKHDITKLCADSLRSYLNDKYGIKLKSGHAHEIVAAFFGFKSRIAMLADKNQIINNWEADFILLDPPIYFILDPTIPLINQRLQNLQDLSPDLPPSHVVAEESYAVLVAQLREYRNLRMSFKLGLPGIKWERGVNIEHKDDGVLLTIDVGYRMDTGESRRYRKYVIHLPRIAANLGYGIPRIDETGYSGTAGKYSDEELLKKYPVYLGPAEIA